MIEENYRVYEESLNQQKLTRHAEIAELAYQKWQEAGEPHGDGVDFWLEAEQQWEKNRELEERWQPVTDDEGFHMPIRGDWACCHNEAEEVETPKKPTLLERLKWW